MVIILTIVIIDNKIMLLKMTKLEQLFRSIRNTEPKFDYHSQMNAVQFYGKNMKIIKAKVELIEFDDFNDHDAMAICSRLLEYLPHKPKANYPVQKESDPEFWMQFAELGSKRDKKRKIIMITLQQIEEMEAFFRDRELPEGEFQVAYSTIWLDREYIRERIRLMKINPQGSKSNDYYDKLMEVRIRLDHM